MVAEKPRAQGPLGRHLTPTDGTPGPVDLKAQRAFGIEGAVHERPLV